MDIKFKASITLANYNNDEEIVIERVFTKKKIVLECGTKTELYRKKFRTYFEALIKSKCIELSLDEKQLYLIGFEIQGLEEDTLVSFGDYDFDSVSLDTVISIEAKTKKELTAKLNVSQISDSTAKWYWDMDFDNAHYIIDEKGEVVAHLPIGVSVYIEGSLEANKTYRRRLVKYNADSISVPSAICAVTIIKKEEVYPHELFKEEERLEDIVDLELGGISSRLRAFQSGIGDKHDCEIIKTNDTRYAKRFALVNKIYGIRANPKVKHNTIKFRYRFKLKAKMDALSYDSGFKIKLTAYKVPPQTTSPVVVDKTPIRHAEEFRYPFCKDIQVADIYACTLLPAIGITDGKYKYKQRYKFVYEIYEVVGNITVCSHAFGEANVIEGNTLRFEEFGYYNHRLAVKGEPILVTKDYEEIYPPLKFEALVGAINGDFEMKESGLKDLNILMPKFNTSEYVYDKKYYCEVEEVSPIEGNVMHKFENQVASNAYTLINGDWINFKSESILQDDTEIKEFITQLETEEHTIQDNRKHTYKYRLEDIEVNPKNYKRFELEVVASNNNVVILNHTKVIILDGNFVDTHVTTVVRAIHNAIARWSPLVHAGYYYLNQDEYYMYSKCISDGDGKVLQEIYKKNSVSIKCLIDALEPAGPVETYDIVKKTRLDLLINDKLYDFIDESIYPKAQATTTDPFFESTTSTVIGDYYYDFLKEYHYISEPYIFIKEPTKILSILWDFICNAPNELDVFLIPYNSVHGEWDNPIKITSGQVMPSSVIRSKIYTLKFLMKPSRKPALKTRTYIIAGEYDWTERMDNYVSQNLYTEEEALCALSPSCPGDYISKAFDFGDTSEYSSGFKNRKLKLELKKSPGGSVKVYYQTSDKLSDLERLRYSNWVEFSGEVNVLRYARYRIVLNNAAVLNLKLTMKRYEYTGMRRESYLPSFGNIRFKAEYNPGDTYKRYENIISSVLPFDTQEHVLIDNIKEYLEILSTAHDFDVDRISRLLFEPYGENKAGFSIRCDTSIPVKDAMLYAKSYDTILDHEAIESAQGGVIHPVLNNKSILTPIPQQFSPIIVYEQSVSTAKEPLTQVFFIDKEKKELGYVLTNTELFIASSFKTYYLEFINIDASSLVVTVGEKVVTNYKLIDNVIKFDSNLKEGLEILVKYKLNKSFIANYNYLKGEVELSYNGVKTSKVKVYIETNENEATRMLTNVSLNPIHSVRHGGYIYISDYILEPHSLSIHPESLTIFANGKDTMRVLIKVSDKNQNPCEGVNVNVASAFGKIKKIDKRTDSNGVILCEYTSWTGNCYDEIKAIVASDVKNEIVITNRTLGGVH